MSRTHATTFGVPESGTQLVDMTGQGTSLRTLEVHTDAGIIRVNTNLVNVRDNRPTVVVEVEPNINGRLRTEAGGNWTAEVLDRLTRIDVHLTREG